MARDVRSAHAILAALHSGESPDAAAVAHMPEGERAEVVSGLLAEPAGRRWLRAHLLPLLAAESATLLAERLLAFREDFSPHRRDRTTPLVVTRLPLARLREEAPFLAGSNASTVLWERIQAEAPGSLLDVALDVMRQGDRVARETTLYGLILDPYGPVDLAPMARRRLLRTALDDPDDEIRGLAAEVVADEEPGWLLDDLAHWVRDASERVRMAAWTAAFQAEAERSAEDAIVLLTDESAPLSARRTALIALGDFLPTARVEPILAVMVRHPNESLAQDAANLLWSRHRSPVVAQAAAESPHEGVRAIAQRLLHPTLGSPAAGGFRPGAEQQGYDFYDEFHTPRPEREP